MTGRRPDCIPPTDGDFLSHQGKKPLRLTTGFMRIFPMRCLSVTWAWSFLRHHVRKVVLIWARYCITRKIHHMSVGLQLFTMGSCWRSCDRQTDRPAVLPAYRSRWRPIIRCLTDEKGATTTTNCDKIVDLRSLLRVLTPSNYILHSWPTTSWALCVSITADCYLITP